MTHGFGRYRWWGDKAPDQSRPLLTVTRAERVTAVREAEGEEGAEGGASSATGTLRIYGPIDEWGGWWGVSAKEVATALDLLGDVDRVIVRINSPGGDAFEGRAIANLLRAHKAEIVTVVDGLAASAASYVACAGAERVMSPGTEFMIHDTHAIMYGDAAAFRKEAGILESISRAGAEVYAAVSGKGTVETWRAAQVEETWYTANEAVESGLMTRVGVVPDSGPVETAADEPDELELGELDDAAKGDRYDLSIFRHKGRGDAPPPPSIAELAQLDGTRPPSASASGSITTTQEETAVTFNDAQLATMRQELGLAEDADEATIVAALSEALRERAEDPTPGGNTPPPGTTVVEEGVLAQLRADAEAGRQARQAQLDAHRDRVLDDAIKVGKIPAGRREHYASMWAGDAAGTEELIGRLEAGLVPLAELGQDDGTVDRRAVPESDAAAAAAAFGLSEEVYA